MSTNLAELKTGAVAQEKPTNIMQLLGNEKNKKQLASLAGKFMTPDRILALCVNAVRKTPRLAECDPQSVLGAMMAAAGLGLEPNTPTQQAFLIPYKKRVKQGDRWVDAYECQFQIGYRGFITLAYRSPNVLSIQAEAIHQNDVFEHMQGSKEFLTFKKTMVDRGPMIGAFCLIKLRDGAEVAVTLPLEELHKIRAKSETYNALVKAVGTAENEKDRIKAEGKLNDTPWVMWEDSMAAKSAIKQLVSKRLSLNSNDPIQIANNLDERAIDLSAMTDPVVSGQVFGDGIDPPLALSAQETDQIDFSTGEIGARESVVHEGQAVRSNEGGMTEAEKRAAIEREKAEGAGQQQGQSPRGRGRAQPSGDVE